MANSGHRQSSRTTAGGGDGDSPAHIEDERSPLLSREARHLQDPERDDVREDDRDANSQPTPLPVVQLAVICLMRITEPISYTVLFPFINNYLHRNLPDIPKTELGYYAGVVESVFAFVQFLTIFQWGRLSDRIGRKPVLITGLTGTAISISAFGLARSLFGMILARSIAGALNGNIGVLKSTLAELTDETNQARAFSLIPLCYAVGSIFGPIMGAWLSEPAETFPALFDTPFFRANPYFLPCATAGMLNLLAAIFGFFFLTETLPTKVAAARPRSSHVDAQSVSKTKGVATPPLIHRLSEGDLHQARRVRREGSCRSMHGYESLATSVPVEATQNPPSPKPSVRSLLSKDRFRVLSSQMLLNFLNISYVALVPLFGYESAEDGGISFSKADIGYLLALNGKLKNLGIVR